MASIFFLFSLTLTTTVTAHNHNSRRRRNHSHHCPMSPPSLFTTVAPISSQNLATHSHTCRSGFRRRLVLLFDAAVFCFFDADLFCLFDAELVWSLVSAGLASSTPSSSSPTVVVMDLQVSHGQLGLFHEEDEDEDQELVMKQSYNLALVPSNFPPTDS